jgi:NitT/TauT family transport system ATP-binding protein
LVGPSGSGKSSLLRAVMGLQQPLAGIVEPGVAQSEIGMLFQDDALLPWRTARDNVALGLGFRSIARKSALVQADYWLHRVGLAGFEHRYPWELSGGMQQRVALARAFLHDPDLLLLDEPYSGLDPRAADHLQGILQRFHGRAKTIVLTTHDIGRGLEVCDRAAILRGGRMVWQSGRFVPGLQEMARIYERQASAS